MKTRTRILFVVLALVVVVAAVTGLWLKRWVTRTATEALFRQLSGFEVSVERVDVRLFPSSVELLGLRILNPPGYPEREAFEIARVFTRYDLRSLFSDRAHLKELSVDVPRTVVVRNAEGETNLERFRVDLPAAVSGGAADMVLERTPRANVSSPPAAPPKASATPAANPRPAAEATAMHPASDVQIDELTIRVGTIAVRDYSGGGAEPLRFDYPVNDTIRMTNVTDFDQVARELESRLFSKAFANLGVLAEQALAQYDDVAERLQDEIKDLEERTGVDLSGLGKLLGAAAGSSAGDASAEESTGGNADDLMKAVGGLLKGLSAPPAE